VTPPRPGGAPKPAEPGEAGGGLPGVGSVAPRVGETVETVVKAVRDKTIVPAERAARNVGLVLLVAFVAMTMFALVLIGAMRWLTELTALIGPGYEFVAYLALGGILFVAGLFTWRLRKPH